MIDWYLKQYRASYYNGARLIFLFALNSETDRRIRSGHGPTF